MLKWCIMYKDEIVDVCVSKKECQELYKEYRMIDTNYHVARKRV